MSVWKRRWSSTGNRTGFLPLRRIIFWKCMTRICRPRTRRRSPTGRMIRKSRLSMTLISAVRFICSRSPRRRPGIFIRPMFMKRPEWQCWTAARILTIRTCRMSSTGSSAGKCWMPREQWGRFWEMTTYWDRIRTREPDTGPMSAALSRRKRTICRELPAWAAAMTIPRLSWLW